MSTPELVPTPLIAGHESSASSEQFQCSYMVNIQCVIAKPVKRWLTLSARHVFEFEGPCVGQTGSELAVF